MAALHHSPTRYLPSGYTFHGARLNDLPMIVCLLSQRHPGLVSTQIEDLRREWQTSGFNPAMGVRLALEYLPMSR